MSRHTEVLIIGAGPAGMAAALAAAPRAASIVIIDDNPLPGGQIWRDGPGAQVLRIAEQASALAVASFAGQLPRWPHNLWQSLSLLNRNYRTSTHVLEALGSERLEAVRLQQQGNIVELACDRLACGFGLIPNTGIGQALGYALNGQALAVDAWQRSSRCRPLRGGRMHRFWRQ